MTLHQINLFLAVCSHNSLTEAAEAVHISQPSLSAAIKQLEDEFGVSLFVRRRKRLILTDEGEQFREEAEKISRDAERLETKMKNLGKVGNSIHVGMPAMAEMVLYHSLIMPFCSQNPDIRVISDESSAEKSMSMIQNGRLGLAIVYDNEIIPDQFETIPVARTELVGCCGKDHPLAYKRGVTFKMLEGEKLVLDGESPMTSRQIMTCFREAGVRPNVMMYSHQFLLMTQEIGEDNAIGFFFEDIFKDNDNLAPFYLEEPILFTHLLIRSKDALLPVNERKFVDYCEKHRVPGP